MRPVFIFCANGFSHVVMCIWAIRSLRRFGYDAIEVIVSKEAERLFLVENLGDIQCEVIKCEMQGYRIWAWRPFVLEKYTIKHIGRDVVICDTDILWKQDPVPLLERFCGMPWVHKITSLDPGEFDDYESAKDIPERRIGLRTMVAYRNRVGLKCYPNFHLNCGLFMLQNEIFGKVLERWVTAIRSIPPEEMIMTEALLALVYAEMGLSPVSDRLNIKHLGISHRMASRPVIPFKAVDLQKGHFTGYQTAKHYYGDQRYQLFKDVASMGLDSDGLVQFLIKEQRAKYWQRILRWPRKIVLKFLR